MKIFKKEEFQQLKYDLEEIIGHPDYEHAYLDLYGLEIVLKKYFEFKIKKPIPRKKK